MLSIDDIDRLLAIGKEHLEELVGSSPARAAGSDPVEDAAAASAPASFDAGCSSERASL